MTWIFSGGELSAHRTGVIQPQFNKINGGHGTYLEFSLKGSKAFAEGVDCCLRVNLKRNVHVQLNPNTDQLQERVTIRTIVSVENGRRGLDNKLDGKSKPSCEMLTLGMLRRHTLEMSSYLLASVNLTSDTASK